MNDQYDLYCIEKLREHNESTSVSAKDPAVCGCQDYLDQQGIQSASSGEG